MLCPRSRLDDRRSSSAGPDVPLVENDLFIDAIRKVDHYYYLTARQAT
jgi:hypothetical protein